jgi:hypothetical protein
MEPLLFIFDPQSKQSSRINNIDHTIPLVGKPKSPYSYIEWKQLPTWTKTVVMTKCRKCIFTTLLMTPWTKEHKEDSKTYSYGNTLLIYKSGWYGHGWHEPFCSPCHCWYKLSATKIWRILQAHRIYHYNILPGVFQVSLFIFYHREARVKESDNLPSCIY